VAHEVAPRIAIDPGLLLELGLNETDAQPHPPPPRAGGWRGGRGAAEVRRACPIPAAGAAARGAASHGPWSHLDAPCYISLLFIPTKYNKARLDDSTAHG
jgi:hypothetical protein